MTALGQSVRKLTSSPLRLPAGTHGTSRRTADCPRTFPGSVRFPLRDGTLRRELCSPDATRIFGAGP